MSSWRAQQVDMITFFLSEEEELNVEVRSVSEANRDKGCMISEKTAY